MVDSGTPLVAGRKQNMKKILFISYDGMTDPLGQSQVIPYLQGLSNMGFQFFILSCEKEETFIKNKSSVEKLLQGYTIEWHPVAYTKKPPILSTLKDIFQLRKKAAAIYRLHKIDMVHTRPGIPSMVGSWMKKEFGIKFLNDIREFYADSRIDGGIWNGRNPIYKTIYRYFKKNEQQELAISDGIVCLTKAAEKIILASPYFQNGTPLKVIPCSADLAVFDYKKINAATIIETKKQLGITEEDFIVSYLGSVGGWYMTNEMLHFCKLLLNKKPCAKFLFISPHLHELIINEAARHGIPRDRIIVKNSNREEVPTLLSVSNYSIFFIKPCHSKLSSSPTKHGEIMAMGIPVITNSGVGDVQQIVQKYQSGFVINEFDDTAFNEVIEEITMGKSFDRSLIRKGAEEVYSLEMAVQMYGDLYRQLLY